MGNATGRKKLGRDGIADEIEGSRWGRDHDPAPIAIRLTGGRDLDLAPDAIPRPHVQKEYYLAQFARMGNATDRENLERDGIAEEIEGALW